MSLLKAFSISGPSVTGVQVSIQNLHLSGRTFALLMGFCWLFHWTLSDLGWWPGPVPVLALCMCLVRIVAPVKDK